MKKHQHFIPKAYLKHFAHTINGDRYLVAGYNKISKETNWQYSINDLCVETDLYTLDHNPKLKYALEDFFAEKIENNIPIMYKILVKNKQQNITPSERDIILITTLSMYFRTPKVLNEFSNFIAQLLYSSKNTNVPSSIRFMNNDINLEGKTFAEIKKKIKEENKIDYLKTQLELFTQFLEFKKNDGFTVIQLMDGNEYITSDNPVEIGKEYRDQFNLFDTDNSIYVPLDKKNALFIAPKLDGIIHNRVFYRRDNYLQHVVLNHQVYQNAERWIIGTKHGITLFLHDEEEYGKPANADHPILLKMRSKAETLEVITNLIEKGIHNNSELITFWKHFINTDLYRDSIEFQDLYRQLKNLGVEI